MKSTYRSGDFGLAQAWHNDPFEGVADGHGTSYGSSLGFKFGVANGFGFGGGNGSGPGNDPLHVSNDDARRTDRVFHCAGCVGGFECPIHGRRL